MSYVKCPSCGEKILVFGNSRVDETAAALGISTIEKVPLDPTFARACDSGEVEDLSFECFSHIMDCIEKL